MKGEKGVLCILSVLPNFALESDRLPLLIDFSTTPITLVKYHPLSTESVDGGRQNEVPSRSITPPVRFSNSRL